jgi:hypothetical protein
LNLLHRFFGSFIILFMRVHANTFAKIGHCSSFMVASYNRRACLVPITLECWK